MSDKNFIVDIENYDTTVVPLMKKKESYLYKIFFIDGEDVLDSISSTITHFSE